MVLELVLGLGSSGWGLRFSFHGGSGGAWRWVRVRAMVITWARIEALRDDGDEEVGMRMSIRP